MPAPGPQDLWDYITKANPYSAQMTFRLDSVEWENYTEEGANWGFRGEPQRVRRAIRIPYTYPGPNGLAVLDYLLIGYEGAGGP